MSVESNPAVDLKPQIADTILDELWDVQRVIDGLQSKWNREQEGIDYFESKVESALERQTQLSVELDELVKKREDLKRNLKSVL